MQLTKIAVERLEAHATRDRWCWDDKLKGFGVRVKPTGRKTYLVQYRNVNGRTRRFTLGPHGVLTATQARKAALKVLAEAARGRDPSAERRAKRASTMVAGLAERYLEEHARPKKKPSSARTDEANLRLHVLPALGTRQVTDVARFDIARLHHEMRATPGAANRVLALLSKMFNLAEVWGLRPDGSNPCRHIARFPEQKLERYLSEEELARLGQALRDAEANGTELPATVAAIRLLIFTGCRLSEILTLRWNYVDLERCRIRFPDSKTGAKTIPLNEPAIAVLKDLPISGEYVIRGAKLGKHLVNLRKPWYRIRVATGLDDVRLHDLRHTFASVGASAGLGLPIIGKLLSHTQAATTQRYAHLADDPVRAASEEIAQRIKRAMSALASTKVVALPVRDGAKILENADLGRDLRAYNIAR
jgi:integrase